MFRRGWRVSIGAIALLPQLATEPILGQWGVRVDLYAASLRGCHVWRSRWIDGGICAMFDIGAMVGEGVNLPDARVDGGAYADTGVGATFALRFSDRVSVRVDASPVLVFAAPRFYTSGSTDALFQPSVFSIRVGASVEIDF
jgi:hypothetical protein